MEQRQWLTRNEAAKRAGVHYNVIREWQRKGYVETRKDGPNANAEILTDLTSLDKYLSTRQTGSRFSDSDTRERMASLEAEIRELRSALTKSETERRGLLERVLRLAERSGERGEGDR
ncbi:MAG: hypothetical protein ACR2L3_03680 [Actinomycetota bacterium]